MTVGKVIALALLFGVYLGLAAVVPVWDDELYYWCWSRKLQLSYFDHPPLTAYLIRLSTALFGHSLVAIRLPACLAMTLIVALLAPLIPHRGLLLAVLLTPVFSLGAVIITPDTPLLLAWTIYLVWLIRVHERLDTASLTTTAPLWWLGGLILGAGMLGKYTMALSVPPGLTTFLVLGPHRWRQWLAGYALHGGVAVLLASPILFFNLQHSFAPLRFQWEHIQSVGGSWVDFGSFLGVQILLVGTMPLVMLPWVLWRYRSWMAVPQLRVCAVLYALPLGFFLYKAARGPLEGNWALVSFLAFWPLAGQWLAEKGQQAGWRWATRAAFAPPLLVVVLLAIHLVWPLPLLPANNDRITRQVDRLRLAGNIARHLRHQAGTVPVFTPNYQWVALLRYQGVNGIFHDPRLSRPSHFTLNGPAMEALDRAYYLCEVPLPAELAQEFAAPIKVATFDLTIRGEHFLSYHLWLYSRAPRPIAEPTQDLVAQ